MNSMCKVKIYTIVNIKYHKIKDVSKKKIQKNVSISCLHTFKKIYDKNFTSFFCDIMKGCINSIYKMSDTISNIIPNQIDIMKSKLNSLGLINILNKSVKVVKNIFSFQRNISNIFTKNNHYYKIYLNIKKLFQKLYIFHANQYFSFIDFPYLSGIDNVYYHIDNNHIRIDRNVTNLSKISVIFLQENIKKMNWVTVDARHQISNIDDLSKKIFHDAQNCTNIFGSNIKIPTNNGIIIDGKYLSSELHYSTLDSLKQFIPNTILRNLVLSCFQHDLTSQPCLEIFYHSKEIEHFKPEKAAVFYVIQTNQDKTITLTVTYLGRLIKLVARKTSQQYTNFGARASIILSIDELPKIQYFNFIN
ncbi:hypothetical protein [Buchnera aphidicola]|nr:hypothetical protein [Buchnera aphidicola]